MLPPTNALRAGGAALGAGLGSLFDAPRQALTNLAITPWMSTNGIDSPGAHLDQPAEYDPILGMLPGLGGMAMGGLAASNPVTAPFAGLVGAGTAGLAQYLMGMVAPEKMAAPSADQILKAMGQDPSSGVGRAESFGLGLATDPLMWAGGFAGDAAGQAVGGARDALAERAALEPTLKLQQGALEEAQGLANQGVQSFESQANPWASAPAQAVPAEAMATKPSPSPSAWMGDALEQGPQATYRPEVLGQLPNVVGQNVPYLGNFRDVGGLRFNPDRPGMVFDPVLNYMDTMEPMPPVEHLPPPPPPMSIEEYQAARQQMGFGALGGSNKVPTLAQQLGPDMTQPIANHPAFGDVANMPLYDARDQLNQMAGQNQSQLSALQAQQPSQLQSLLLKMGLAR